MDGDPLHEAVPLEKQSSALSRQSTYKTTPEMARRMTEQREAELAAKARLGRTRSAKKAGIPRTFRVKIPLRHLLLCRN